MVFSRLRELAELASPGPWSIKRHTCGMDGSHSATDDWTIYSAEGTTAKHSICYEGSNPRLHDPEYIAEANPQTILQLLNEHKLLLDTASTLLEHWDESKCNDVASTAIYFKALETVVRQIKGKRHV